MIAEFASGCRPPPGPPAVYTAAGGGDDFGMQIPAEITALYDQPPRPPFATVFLDATRAKEQGGEEVRLRWQAAREREGGWPTGRSGGADDQTLAAIDEVIGGHLESRASTASSSWPPAGRCCSTAWPRGAPRSRSAAGRRSRT